MPRQVGGLGYRRGQDSRVNQDESDRVRRALEPSYGGLVLSHAQPYLTMANETVATANRLRLQLIPPTAQGYLLVAARLYVGTAVAASTFRSALYTYTATGYRHFKKVLGSEAIFNTATTGTKTVALEVPVKIEPNTAIWLGTIGSDATSALASIASASTAQAGVATLRRDLSSTELPSVIAYASLTKSYDERVFNVPYLSNLAHDLL